MYQRVILQPSSPERYFFGIHVFFKKSQPKKEILIKKGVQTENVTLV